MKKKHLLIFAVAVLLLCSLYLTSCNTPLDLGPEPGAGEGEPSNLSGGGNISAENQDAGGSSDNQTYPPNYGKRRIEYDHQFSLNAMQGGGGLEMEITVSGNVPLKMVAIGEGPMECEGKTILWPLEKLQGESKVEVKGTGTFSTGDESCSCKLSTSIEVKAQGITHPMRANADDGCDTIFLSVQLDETWYTNPDWTCTCSDADDNPVAEMGMERMPAVTSPDLSEKTLRFTYPCPGSFRQEQLTDPTGTLKGRYIWTWRPAIDESKGGRAISTLTTEDLDITQFPQGAPSCAWVREAVFGPPLSSINPGVIEWFSN